MQWPTRLAYSARPRAPIAMLAGTSAVALMYAATPFLITPISDRYEVSEGIAGTLSVAQVGAFAAANFLLPRLIATDGRIFRGAAAALVILNLASLLPSTFWVLVILRAVAGFAAGTLTWVAWTDAMRVKRSLAGIAAAGPLSVLIGAPVLSAISTEGDRAVYAALAVITIPTVVSRLEVAEVRRSHAGVSGSRSNRVLLAAIWGLTFFGSSLFINEALVARDIHGISSVAASVAFSLNAAGGLAGARLSAYHRRPGWWLASAGIAAFATVNGPAALFYIGMTWWGFAFWMAVPGILVMLSERSLEPGERAGDAQGLMAVGRSLGPGMGGFFVDAGSLTTLSVVSSVGLLTAATTVIGVQEGRERLPPTDPRTARSPEA